jgi:hypothetical protein
MTDEHPAVTASRLDDHEKICAERYAGIKDNFKDVFKDLNAIKYGLIGLLITMVGYLVVNGVPWPK